MAVDKKLGVMVLAIVGCVVAVFQFNPALASTLSTCFAGVALTLNFYQSRSSNKQTRSALVAKFLSDFVGNDDMQSIFYAIEYSKFKYDDEFHESENERKLDKVLVHFANLSIAWKSGLLQKDDLVPVQYFVRRLLRDKGVNDYLRFLDNWSDYAELGEHPYQTLKKLGVELGA